MISRRGLNVSLPLVLLVFLPLHFLVELVWRMAWTVKPKVAYMVVAHPETDESSVSRSALSPSYWADDPRDGSDRSLDVRNPPELLRVEGEAALRTGFMVNAKRMYSSWCR